MRTDQRGAVSIFIVIFTSLLVTIVTTSFVQIMIRNQQQASNNDLSQSAYDSAMAGVEDAKRALVALKECDKDAGAVGRCATLRSALERDDNCLTLEEAGVVTFVNGEVPVGDDPSLNQAYTCVTVQAITDSYEGTLEQDRSVVIPLITSDPDTARNITGVRISWFMQKDIPEGVDKNPRYDAASAVGDLPLASAWHKNQPSIMRSQLIQFEQGNISLGSFDAENTKNSLTRFLYPGRAGSGASFGDDGRRAEGSTNSPVITECVDGFSTNVYACSTVVDVPQLDNPDANKEAYLQLSSLYNKASYKVEMIGASGRSINFDNVQPKIDSTGRASDLFRRVSARVSIDSMPSYFPTAALQVNNNLCKDFFVTNNNEHYNPNPSGRTNICEPAVNGAATP